MNSREIVLWLDDQWYQALTRRLKPDRGSFSLNAGRSLCGRSLSDGHSRRTRDIRTERATASGGAKPAPHWTCYGIGG